MNNCGSEIIQMKSVKITTIEFLVALLDNRSEDEIRELEEKPRECIKEYAKGVYSWEMAEKELDEFETMVRGYFRLCAENESFPSVNLSKILQEK